MYNQNNAYLSDQEKVRFDMFSEGTQTYVESCYAFASTALAAELHRQHGYRVRFNDNQQYPQKHIGNAKRIGHQRDTRRQLGRGALAGSTGPKWLELLELAEREGFEPSVQVLARTTV